VPLTKLHIVGSIKRKLSRYEILLFVPEQVYFLDHDLPNINQSYELLMDPYHKVPRLNLYRFDGSPMAPMYIWSTTPNMLPTTTLHPKPTSTAKHSRAMRRIKRSIHDSANFHADINSKIPRLSSSLIDPNIMWWMGLGFSSLGGVLYFCF
jgi:hypothetical protein